MCHPIPVYHFIIIIIITAAVQLDSFAFTDIYIYV